MAPEDGRTSFKSIMATPPKNSGSPLRARLLTARARRRELLLCKLANRRLFKCTFFKRTDRERERLNRRVKAARERLGPLLEVLRKRLYKVVRRLPHASREDAEDLAHTAILWALEHPLAIDHDSLPAYLARSVGNRYIDLLRKQTTATRNAYGAENTGGEGIQKWRFVSDDEYVAAVNNLPETLHDTYLFGCVLHLKYKDVAAIMCVKANTIASRISKARILLRSFLTGLPGGIAPSEPV